MSIRSISSRCCSRRASGDTPSATNTPAPCRLVTSPSLSSSRYARATVLGLISNCSASFRTGGSCSPAVQPARRDQVLDLADQLDVDRHPVLIRNPQLHDRFPRRSALMYHCTNSLIQFIADCQALSAGESTDRPARERLPRRRFVESCAGRTVRRLFGAETRARDHSMTADRSP